MRYFAELSYNGSKYCGWQRQPQQITVQETIENALSTILNKTVAITGCGRTDTGVHASQYFLHFDWEREFPENFLFRLNKFLPADIAIRRIFAVNMETHARYDATQRSYCYYIGLQKAPFHTQTRYFFPAGSKLDLDQMQDAAKTLLAFEEFLPFCKTGHDSKTLKCQLFRAEWEIQANENLLLFHISANRFLRGMVRLVVGMCLNVGQKKLSVSEVEAALANQTRLKKSLSVPPQGLFLTEVRYPFLAEAPDHKLIRR